MLTYEKELEGVKKIVMIESYILVVVTACSGIVYGAESGRWLEAVEFFGVTICIIAIIMLLTYCRAEHRMHVLIYFSSSGKKHSDQNIIKALGLPRFLASMNGLRSIEKAE